MSQQNSRSGNRFKFLLRLAAIRAVPARTFAGLVLLFLVLVRLNPCTSPLLADISFSRAVYARDDSLLYLSLADDDRYRLYTPLRDFAPELREAVLLQEDRWFYYHPGINPVSLTRAFFKTYVREDGRQGASTISMQVARMLYGLNTKTAGGKIKQILRALQLEACYGKNEILEAYLNLVPMGGNIEGAGAAAHLYFGKRARALELIEALTLAVIPKSPARRTPRDYGNLRLFEARNGLFQQWIRINPRDKLRAREFEETVLLVKESGLADGGPAPHFAHFAATGARKRELRRGRSLDVRSTLSVELQKIVHERIRAYLASHRSAGIHNASALLVDRRDMEARAWVGSADFLNESIQGQVDGILAKRSPGSTLKPFVYALAFARGQLHPMSLLKDTPASFGAYAPENFDRDFMGPVFVRDALNRSRNVPAIRVAAELHDPDLYDFLKSGGVELPMGREHYQLAIVLGAAETTMLELVTLYGVLANAGIYQPVQIETNLENNNPGERLLDPRAVFLTLDMMKENPRPTFAAGGGNDAAPVYWKTGTSIGFRDAWAVGLFDDFVLAVWIGDFQGDSNPNFVGRGAAGPLFFQIVEALRARPEHQITTPAGHIPPEGVRRVEVCALSGALPREFCPHRTETWFAPGLSPIQSCEIHREVLIDPMSGLRLCGPPRQGIRAEVYEFWPGDLRVLFKQAGIQHREPPSFTHECRAPGDTGPARPPAITSPLSGVTYTIRLERPEAERKPIALAAVADGEARKFYWFLDNSFLGESPADRPLLWTPRPGRFILRVVDEHGAADSRELIVEGI